MNFYFSLDCDKKKIGLNALEHACCYSDTKTSEYTLVIDNIKNYQIDSTYIYFRKKTPLI